MIPRPLLQELLKDKRFQKCERAKENNCQGRLTFEHVWVYAGKQIQEKWALICLCAYHHAVYQFLDCGDLNKELNQYLSLCYAKEQDFAKYPRRDWGQIKTFLFLKYKDY